MWVKAMCGSLYSDVVIKVDRDDARSGERCNLKVESSAFMFAGLGVREEGGREAKLCDIRSDIDSAVDSGKSDDEEIAV